MIRFLFLLAVTAILFFSPLPEVYPETKIVSWQVLSDKDISPEGRAALSLNKEAWKHSESEHFIYHFMDEKESETVILHAEAYYKWIKDFFGIKDDRWRKKSHIFIFTDADVRVWDSLMGRLGRPKDKRSFTNGWELFLYRAPFWVAPRYALGHELTHVIVFRFLDGPIPLFLNEGFSSFATSQLVKMQLEMDGYRPPYINPVIPGEYIPLGEIITIEDYPAGKEEAFYRESEWFVRFLAFRYGREKLYSFMRAVAAGKNIINAVQDTCGEGIEGVEKKFKKYATEGI